MDQAHISTDRQAPAAGDQGTAGDVQPVTLVQFPAVWGRNISPFALKLETWLKLADIPFFIRETRRFTAGPKGKLPFIRDAGLELGDSSLIIAHLKHTRDIDPDGELSERERADMVALQRLFEDHLYYALLHSRWIEEETWPLVADAFFGSIPAPMRQFKERIRRRQVARLLDAQGLGRHSHEEILGFAREDLAAISAYLGDRPFFMGERLTTVDAIAYGFLANILLVPLETPLKRLALEFPNLRSWCETMDQGLGAQTS